MWLQPIRAGLAWHEKLFLESETDGQVCRNCEITITKAEVQFIEHPSRCQMSWA
jgi:hypothetical protein